ncbi:MAG TPA: PIG-L family deacetylase [Roseateles sp.]
MLVLAPHPDDEAIGCGGTVLRHVATGDHVVLAIVTDGRRSGGMRDPDGMAAIRLGEARGAAAVLQAGLDWLGLPEGDWSVEQLRDSLMARLEQLRPDVVYAPSRVDFHPEHHKVAHALALALEAVSHRPEVLRVYQVQVPLTRQLVNVVSDLSSVLAPSEAALRKHRSQAGTIASIFRRRRYSAKWHALPTAAEEFWEMPVQRYVELHRAPPAQWHDHYRGIRAFSFTDPLAWLVGRKARRRLNPD